MNLKCVNKMLINYSYWCSSQHLRVLCPINSCLPITTKCVESKFPVHENLYFHHSCVPITIQEIKSNFSVFENFVNEEEESSIIKEVEPHLKRLKYEFDHWDDAIHGFREIEKTKWSSKCAPVLKRIQETSFGSSAELISQVHVLDLSPDGIIKPHVDSIRFCGDTIAGLCLLSNAVMRLVKEDQKDQIIDIFLPRRSLYIMRNESRYKYTHEVLDQKQSYFGDMYVEKNRRISIICRNPPI